MDTITAIKKALEGVNATFLRVLAESPDMRAIALIPATLESLQRENERLYAELKREAELATHMANDCSDEQARANVLENELKRYRAALSEIATDEEYRILTAEEAQTVARVALSGTGDTHGN